MRAFSTLFDELVAVASLSCFTFGEFLAELLILELLGLKTMLQDSNFVLYKQIG